MAFLHLLIMISWYIFTSIEIKLVNTAMRGCLYFIAVILVIGWLLGMLVWNAGKLIYVLLVLAVISLLLGLIRGR